MHGQLGTTHVDGTYSSSCSNQGSDGRATSTILSDHKFLDRGQGRTSSYLSNQYTRDTRRSVPLIGIPLNDHTRIHMGLVILFVSCRIIWMQGMGLVTANDKGLANDAFVGFVRI